MIGHFFHIIKPRQLYSPCKALHSKVLIPLFTTQACSSDTTYSPNIPGPFMIQHPCKCCSLYLEGLSTLQILLSWLLWYCSEQCHSSTKSPQICPFLFCASSFPFKQPVVIGLPPSFEDVPWAPRASFAQTERLASAWELVYSGTAIYQWLMVLECESPSSLTSGRGKSESQHTLEHTSVWSG